MAFSKPYPPTPITYLQYNALVDALETRGGDGFAGYIKDRTQILNSRGNLWDFDPGNVQLAINDLLNNSDGGAIWLPKGKVIETDQWLIDTALPIHILGSGMCWHGLDRGTMVEFAIPNGKNCVEFYEAGQVGHFGGLYDMTLYPTSGNQDVVKIDGWSDWHMERVYMNQGKRHGLHVESTKDVWNLWIKDNLIENCVGAGIRLEGGAAAGVILKSYFLNNYFFSNAIDIELGALDGILGKVRLCQFHNNQYFNTDGIGMKFYRLCENIIVNGSIFFATAGDAIDIDDDGAGNKNKSINIINGQIYGNAVTPIGIDLGGYAENIIIDDFQVEGCTANNIVKGANVVKVVQGFNMLEGEPLPVIDLYAEMRILSGAPITVTIDVLNEWHFLAGQTVGPINRCTFTSGNSGTITAVADAGGGDIQVTTNAAHGCVAGQYVTLTGTTDYDGVYEVQSVVDPTNFTVTAVWNINRTGGWARGCALSPDVDVLVSGTCAFTVEALGAGPRFTFAIFKNGVLQDAWQQTNNFPVANLETTLAITGLGQLSEGDILQFGVMNETDATDITIHHMNMNYHFV